MNQRTLQNISYFASLPEMALSFLLPLYCIELGFSPLETTGLFAVVSLALLAAKWCIGGLCDRIGRKKVFQMGLLLKGISYGLLAYAHSAGLLYVGQVLKGVALALVSVSLYAMLSDQKTGAFAARQSRIAAAEGRGQLLGVLLAWVLLLATTFEQGWQILLLVGAAVAFYGAALAHRQLEETQGGALRHGQKLPGKFYGLLTVSVWYSFATAAVGATLVLYLTVRYQVRTEYLALVLLVPAVARTYLSPALGRMSAKIGERQAFALGSLRRCWLPRREPRRPRPSWWCGRSTGSPLPWPLSPLAPLWLGKGKKGCGAGSAAHIWPAITWAACWVPCLPVFCSKWWTCRHLFTWQQPCLW